MQHSVIFNKIKEDVQHYVSGEFTFSFDTARLLFEPLHVHINNEDKKVFQKSNLTAYISEVDSWQQLFSVVRSMGIDVLDVEHRQICNKLLTLLHTIETDYQLFLISLEEFYTIFKNHCHNEEAVIENFSIEQLENQRQTHAGMLSLLQEGILFYKNSKLENIDKTLIHTFYMEFVNHINTLDYESFRKGNWRTLALETMSENEIIFLLRKTGIQMIDEQHQEYITMVMKLFQYINDGRPREEIHTVFKDIIEFAHYHFNEEEKLFPVGISQFSPRHHDEHRKLLENLDIFFKRLSSTTTYSSLVIRETVLKWWLSHTNFTDIDTFGSMSFNKEAKDD